MKCKDSIVENDNVSLQQELPKLWSRSKYLDCGILIESTGIYDIEPCPGNDPTDKQHDVMF